MVFDSKAVRLRIPQDAPRVRLDELMTFAGLIFWVVQAYIDDSGFGTIIGDEFTKLTRYVCLLIFLVRILLSDMHLAARAVSTVAAVFCAVMMVQKMSGAGITFLYIFLMIMALKDISFKKTCKVMFWTCLICYFTVVLADAVGLIGLPPMVDGDRVREYLGFRFVSFPSFYIFNIFFCGAYAYTDLRGVAREKYERGERVEKFPWPVLAFLAVFNLYVYIKTDTNIPFLITTLFILLYAACVYLGWNLFPNCFPMRFLAGICYPALAFFSYEVVVHYNPNSKTWLKIDEKLAHFRIRHSATGLKLYGISPLGQIVRQNGNLKSPNYFYIDSAYMKMLINYGLIFSILLFGIFSLISVAAVKNEDTVLCIWMVCIAAYSLMNNVVLNPEQNCSLFAFWYALGVWTQRKRDKKQRELAFSRTQPPFDSGPDPGVTGPASIRLGQQTPSDLQNGSPEAADEESPEIPKEESSDVSPKEAQKIPSEEHVEIPQKGFAETAGGEPDHKEDKETKENGDEKENKDNPDSKEEKSNKTGKKQKSSEPSVRLNFVMSMAYQVLVVILPMITAPYVARVLGADKSGIYSFTASYQTYFSMFAALGTVSYGSREIARNRKDRPLRSKLFWEIELMTVLTSTISIVAFIAFIASRDRYQIYYIPQIMAILAVMFDISWFFTGIEEFRYIVTKNAVFKLLGAVMIFALVHKPDDLLIYIIILSASTMLGNMSMWIHMPRFLDPVDFRTLTIRRHLKETLVYFIPSVATSIYTVLDKTLIGEITRNEAENGNYDKVVQIINIMKALTFTALNSVLGARISFLFAEKKYDEIRRRIETSINYILFMGLAIGFGLAGVAPRFIPWFLGPGYDRSVMMLIMMSPIVVIIGVSNCLGSQYYTPSGKRAQSARFIIAGSVVNLILNLILIPRFWGYGAIAASLIAELTITILYITFAGESFHPFVLVRDGWKKLIAAALMFAAVRLIDPYFNSNFIALVCEVCLGGAIYIAVQFILRDTFMTGFCMDTVKRVLKR
jgi:O-antigen/teichoic acid export membrane protein